MFAVSLIKLIDINNSKKAEYLENLNNSLSELKMLESQILEADATHDNTIFDSKENELISLQGIESLYLKAEIKRKDLDLCAMEYQVNYGIEKQISTLKIVENYQKGVKEKAAKANEKWNLAKGYFLEEMHNHKTLKAARKAAAERAGIRCEERHLVSMLPDPRKKM